MITVTKGQWFPLTIGNISYGGAAFDLQGATEVSASLVSTLGVRSALSFGVTAYNELSAVSDGSLSAGKYAIEVSCKGADGKYYRMKSPGAVIEVSSSTTPSTGSSSVRVAGDQWELTADVEMHEGQARTYMSLLEEARQKALDAADRANATVDDVTKAVADAGKAAEEAEKAAADAGKAKTLSEEQTAKATEAENARVEAETARVAAESARANSEDARAKAEAARVTAEYEREQGFTEKSAHLDELLQYIKDNHLETDAKIAEAVKNSITGTDKFVYLDTRDGNVKTIANTWTFGSECKDIYYFGKKSITPTTRYSFFWEYNKFVKYLDVSEWDFAPATTLEAFFQNAGAVKYIYFGEAPDFANVTNMSNTFLSCSSLQTLDLSKATLENVTNMSGTFAGCSKLVKIDISSCNISKCTNWNQWVGDDNQSLMEIDFGVIDFSLCENIDFLLQWGHTPHVRTLKGTIKGIKNNFKAYSDNLSRDSVMVVINGLETVTEAKILTLGTNNKPVSLGGTGNDPISDADLKVATDKGWTVQFA